MIYIFYEAFLTVFFLFSFNGRLIAAVESDCFFFKNFLSVLLLNPIAVVLALDLSSWIVLCFFFFLFFDLDLDLSVLSLPIKLFYYLSRLFCDFYPSFFAKCRLLIDNLLGFCESFFLF